MARSVHTSNPGAQPASRPEGFYFSADERRHLISDHGVDETVEFWLSTRRELAAIHATEHAKN